MDEIERRQRHHEARDGRRMTEEEIREHIERETEGEAHESDNRPPWMKIAQVGDALPTWGLGDKDEQ